MPKKKNNHPIDIVRNDIFFVIWIFTFAILIYLTKYFPEVIYEMIVVSIIFLLIFLFEPIIKKRHTR